MKKIFIFFICLFVTLPSLAEDELKGPQLNLRNNVVNFLKEEGFMPEITSSSNIKFKSEGVVYFVSISENDESPMYLVLSMDYLYGETYTKEKIEKAIPNLNFYKGVKVLCFKDSYSYRGELFLVDAESFRYIFYKLMEQIKSMKDELQKICS